MASLDTNALLSLLLPDRPKEQTAVTRLLLKGSYDVADLVFIEIEFTLRKIYNFSRAEVAINIRILSGSYAIKCNSQLLNRVLPLYEANPALSFVDCCLVVYAELGSSSPLYTFDKKLAQQSEGLARLITV